MRRSVVLLIAGVVAVGAIGVAVQAANAGTTEQAAAAPGGAQQRYGIVRYDSAAHRWRILSTPLFQASGLTGVSCTAAGELVVGFDPLSTIGTFVVDEDESYAGRYDAGASAVSDALTITIRRPSTGAVVPCGAAELRIANSSLQVWIVGSALNPTTRPTFRPTTIPPTGPTSLPTPTSPPPTVDSPPTSPEPSSSPSIIS